MTSSIVDASCIAHSNSTLHVILMGTPCERFSKGVLFSTNPKKKVGLHAPPCNLAFTAHQLLLTCKQSRLKYISLPEMVKPYENSIIQQLTQLWGTPHEFNSKKYGRASRVRDFYTSPPNTYNVRMTNDTNNIIRKHCSTATHILHDNWHWPSPQNHQCEQPPTIKAITPQLYDNSHPKSHQTTDIGKTLS